MQSTGKLIHETYYIIIQNKITMSTNIIIKKENMTETECKEKKITLLLHDK